MDQFFASRSTACEGGKRECEEWRDERGGRRKGRVSGGTGMDVVQDEGPVRVLEVARR